MTKEKNERLDYYIQIARNLIDDYADLRKMQEQTDKIARLDWSFPSGMDAEWIREVKTTAPHDAIRAAVRVLAGLDERIKIDPFTIPGNFGEFAREIANQWEVALKWQMDKAVRRRAVLRQDVVRSAVMYDEIVGQVVHLPTQIKAIEKLGGKANRQRAAQRYGDFVINLRNPKNVYTRYSDYMLESVMYLVRKKINDIQIVWNNPELQRLIDKDEAPEDWILFDWSDYDRHTVFVIPGTTLDVLVDPEKTDEAIMLMDEEWKYEFLPWACVVGGSQLEVAPHHSRFPMLYGIWKADQFVNTNIIGSLQISEAIAESAAPKVKKSGIRPESIESHYGEPGGAWEVPAGHDVEAMPQDGLDPALREAYDRFIFEMNQSTLPRVLINAEAGPEETFSGFNLRVQQAMASLTPYKFLSERWFEEAYRVMLNWARVSKEGITGYDKNRMEYRIPAEDIDPNRLYMKIELQQDVPIDRQQRVMTAIQTSQHLKLPTRDVLEQLGETNPDEKIKQWTFEQFDMAYLQGVLQEISFNSANTIQQIITQVEQQAHAQMAEMMQAQAQAQAQIEQEGGGIPGGGGGGLEQLLAAAGGPEGGGFATARGGLPGDQFQPGATSPAQATGLDEAGNPIEGELE
jgi:hypothetical protein